MVKGFRLLAVLSTVGRSWTAEISGNRGFGMSREGSDSEHMLESLVAHRLIDLGSEWYFHHRYVHSAWEIYLANTMRWHPKTSYIVVRIFKSRWQDLFGIKLYCQKGMKKMKEA